MSLNESPDCCIEQITHADPQEVVALVSAYLQDEQRQYFMRNPDCLTSDLHSTKARLGINQENCSIVSGRIAYRNGNLMPNPCGMALEFDR